MTLTLLVVTLGMVPSWLERLHSTSLSRFPFQMSWITEKDVLVSSEIHIDNDFMQTLLKRIDELELELATHKRQVDSLQLQADELTKRGHFEKDLIETQTADIIEAFALLETKVKSQKGQLLIKQKIYQVRRQLVMFFVALAFHLPVLDGFNQHFLGTLHFPLSSAID